MDKLFLTGLLRRNASKAAAAQEVLPSPGRNAAQPAPAITTTATTTISPSGPTTPPPTTPATPANHPPATIAAIGPPYGGRPPEHLLLDAATADMVLLVADDVNYARALPVHREVLRARNAGGYFAKVLAEPAGFAEYSERAAGPGCDAAEGPLATKPMIRRMHWPWQLAACLLSFLYRDSCEVAWEALPELRRMAEEAGAKGLVDAVDYLLDPQHLLPWTVSDLRAAAEELRRNALVEAADKYSAALRATGLVENSRMAAVLYHTRQVRPKLSVSIPPSPSSLPYIDGAVPPPEIPGTPSPSALSPSCPSPSSFASPTAAAVAAAAGALLRLPGTRSFTASAVAASPGGGGGGGLLVSSPSFTSRNGGALAGASLSLPAGGGGGNCTSFTAAATSSSSSSYRDSRLGLHIVDGVLRSVALDSKVLRWLLQPGRRRETVLLCTGSRGGPMGQWGARRLSGLALAAGGSGDGPWRPSPPSQGRTSLELPQLSSRVRSSVGSLGIGGGSGGGGSGSGLGSAVAVQASGGSVSSGAVLFRPSSGGNRGGSGGSGGGGGATATGFGVFAAGGGPQDESLDTTTVPLNLMLIVPAAHLAASLAYLVQRPLDPNLLPPGGGGGSNGGPPPPQPLLGQLGGIGWPGGGGLGSLGLVVTPREQQGGGGGGGGGSVMPVLSGVGSFTNSNWKPLGSDGEWRAGGGAAAGRPSFDPFAKLSGVPGLSWGGGDRGGSGAGGLYGVTGSIGSTAPAASLLQQLPPTSSLGNHDQLSLSLALDFAASVLAAAPPGAPSPSTGPDGSGAVSGSSPVLLSAAAAAGSPAATAAAAAAAAGFSTSRLLSSVLTTLAAADQPQFIVRVDPSQAAQAVSFERRRAASDMSSLNSLAGVTMMGGAGAGAGAGTGGGLAGGGGGGGGGSFSAATACTTAAGAVKVVLGPGNPREYFIPLPDHPTGAVAVSLPVGLVLVDPATLEAVSASSSTSTSSSFALSSFAGGGSGGGGASFRQCSGTDAGSTANGGGGGGGVAASARVAALMPHLAASASALSHVVSAVGMITQILRVAGEQHGLFSSPVIRASLRIANPSTAMMNVLVQTNTHFAVAPLENTIYVRKPPSDIVRLLQALHSTLPNRGSNGAALTGGNGGGVGGGPLTGSGSGGSSGPLAAISAGGGSGGEVLPSSLLRSRLSCHASFTLGPGVSLSPTVSPSASSFYFARQASRTRSFRQSGDVSNRASTSSGYGGGGSLMAAAAPSAAPPPLLTRSSSTSRRVTLTESLNLRASGSNIALGLGGAIGGGGSGGLYGGMGGTTGLPYSHGVPYHQLERLFPGGWQLHIVELSSPGMVVDDL